MSKYIPEINSILMEIESLHLKTAIGNRAYFVMPDGELHFLELNLEDEKFSFSAMQCYKVRFVTSSKYEKELKDLGLKALHSYLDKVKAVGNIKYLPKCLILEALEK